MMIIALLLKYIMLIIFFMAMLLLGVALYFYIKVRKAAKAFRQGAGRSAFSGRARTTEYADPSDRFAAHDAEEVNDSHNDAPHDVCTGEVVDLRPPEVAARKIFARDEGEYAYFEE